MITNRRSVTRLLATCTLAGSALLSGLGIGPATAARFPISYPALSFLDSRTGWVLAARGTTVTVLRTTDAGRSWVRLAHLSLAYSMPAMQFVDGRHGWISTIGPSLCGLKSPPCRTILLRTTDGGQHWYRLVAPTTNGDAVTFVDSLHGWLIQRQVPCRTFCRQSLYATADGGATWHLLRAAPHFELTTMSWVDRERGWIGGGDARSCVSAIFATTDGGSTWSRQLALPGRCGLLQVGMLDARRGWAVGGGDSRQCSMGGCDDYTLYRTVDGGRDWTAEHAPAQRWWVQGRAWGGFPSAPLFVTAHYGWIPFSTGAGPGYGGIGITRDSGHTWRRVLGPYSLGRTLVAPVTTRDGWIAGLSRLCPVPGCNADLLHTTDGGKTWSKLHPPP
jgi:photosystem II stability/assembly factor-like uncharacterized protein